MDVITLFLQNRQLETILEVSNKFRLAILASPPIVLQLVRDPFPLYRFTEVQPISVRLLGGRAYLVNNLFVRKHDEQGRANSLSFITNLFAKACKIHVPNMILTDILYIVEGRESGGERSVQIIEYVPNWVNYSPALPRGGKFVKQLAALLAFDLVVGNGDRFLFISRSIDNILFRDDPEYEQMDLWETPQINEGNFGFVGTDLWSIDHRAHDDIHFILRLHRLLTEEFLQSCTVLMTQFFRLNLEERVLLGNKLSKYVRIYLALFPVFAQLHSWVTT